MWDQRYAGDEFVFGTKPNDFLVEHVGCLSGPVLSLAEGEGRNAVYLASMGFEVYGVDSSAVGLEKAQKLAAARGLQIHTELADLSTYLPTENFYGSVISIFAHLPPNIRKLLHARVERALKPGGIILLEAYAKAQINRNTGGPNDLNLLMSREEIEAEFPHCEIILSREIEREVQEGPLHNGLASVFQFIAKKKSPTA